MHFTPASHIYSLFCRHRVVSTDTRNITPGSLFFALKGEHFNANAFAAEALSKGAAFSIIDDPAFLTDNALLVEDVLSTLQQVASIHRKAFDIPVIGITGSNGKTTTKELVSSVLGSHYRVTSTQGNLNNHIGVPLTLLSVNPETEIAIVEMGANHVGEIEALCRIARPTLGLITNIGKAHLGGFGGYEGVIRAKSELYGSIRESGGKLFVHGGDPLLLRLSEGIDRILYGQGDMMQDSGTILADDPFLEIEWQRPGGSRVISTRLVGDYNFSNVMAAVSIGRYFNVPDEKIVSQLSAYTPANSRSQAIDTGRNRVIMDAYNANPSSMEAALVNFKRMKAPAKSVILGGMKELGDESEYEHTAIARLLKELAFDKVCLAGTEFREPASEFGFPWFEDSSSLHQWLVENPLKGYTILIKGSRGSAMETVLGAL